MRLDEVIGNHPIEADTQYFDAGGVVIGVEHRRLDAATVLAVMDKAKISDEERQKQLDSMPNVKAGGAEEFLSVHVFGPDRNEYLRFDNIDDGRAPHYHYNSPRQGYHTYEPYDLEANGNFLDWVFDCLEHRLDPMLRKAHADDVADGLDRTALEAAIAEARAAVAVNA